MPLATTRRRGYRRAPGHENRSEHNGWSFRLRPCRRLCRPVYGAASGIGIADVAQLGERRIWVRRLWVRVPSSAPRIAQLEEHQTHNLTVEGSIPSPLA